MHLLTYENPVNISQRTHTTSIREKKRLVKFREIINVCSKEAYRKHKYNAEKMESSEMWGRGGGNCLSAS
jgi:hypothetical protein